MEWLKPIKIEDLDPEIYGAVLKKLDREKYRKELIAAIEALREGMWFEVESGTYLSHYSATDTLRVWVSKLNKKYSDRKYFTRIDNDTGNTWVGRLK